MTCNEEEVLWIIQSSTVKSMKDMKNGLREVTAL